jgi:hypothetical protein
MSSMMRTPSHLAIRAFAIIALAIATMLAIASAGFAAQETDAGAVLSKEQWAKIADRLDKNGQIRTLPFKIAEHLGLTKGSETLSVQELAFERDGHQHGIYKSPDPNNDRIVLAFRTPEKRWTAFATDKQFRLIMAIVWNAGESPEPWPNDRALAAFNNELGYWAALAELL